MSERCDPRFGPPPVNADVSGGDAECEHLGHVLNTDGSEFGEGFYWVCSTCGAKGWYE